MKKNESFDDLKSRSFCSLFLWALVGLATLPVQALEPYKSCHYDSSRGDARSKELADLVLADQEDRKNWNQKNQEEMSEVSKRDSVRRKRVGEIFGEGCFKRAADFASAALIFQHGDVPEHFFQTFIWSKRAVELGDLSQKDLIAKSIDRYLVNVGHKQLFGSQALKPDLKPETCWCLEPVEKSFPEKLRKEYTDKTLAEAYEWLRELNTGKTCPALECRSTLKSSPRGTVPGFW